MTDDSVSSAAPISWTRRGVERDLFLASLLALFLETALIRWLPSSVRVLSLFTNFVLIACFLGLGIGLAMANSRRSWTRWMGPGVLGIVVFAVMLQDSLERFSPRRTIAIVGIILVTWTIWHLFRQKRRGLQNNRALVPGLALLGGTVGICVTAWVFRPEIVDAFVIWGKGAHSAWAAVTICFIATALALIPVGQRVGQLFDQCEPIRGYVANIAGSATGVLLLALFAYLRTSPWVWFCCVGLLVMAIQRREKRAVLLTSATLLLAASVLVFLHQRDDIWSPYYKIQFQALRGDEAGRGFELTVNNNYHQKALDLSDGTAYGNGTLMGWRQLYEVPYTFNNPRRILVVGAGTGNDVAAALRSGAERVDAVEIDPVIQEIGRERHPERPYSDPRVHVHIEDARRYLRTSTQKYDAIVYGYLDSHSLFSTLSSVRLDNFVYTREAFQEAVRALNADGVIVVSFFALGDWIGKRMALMLEEVTGRPPLVFEPGNKYGAIFVAGPGISHTTKAPTDFFRRVNYAPTQEIRLVPTDDWPYLYMRDRSVLNSYTLSLVAVLLVSLLMIRTFVPGGFRPSWRFFFLGAGFMLIETRGIVSMSLLYGSTWMVNSVVIFFVLLMILVANLIVLRWRPQRLTPYYAGLFASLGLSMLIPASWFLSFDGIMRIVLSGLWVTLPILFAGVVFAICFQRAKSPSASLGINLLGAVTGGLLEYLSVVLGFWSLCLIAGGLYLASAAGPEE